jgi:chaperonin cofactor prefoldin
VSDLCVLGVRMNTKQHYGEIEMVDSLDSPFETVIFTYTHESKNQLILNELRSRVERQEIRIIDIKRSRDQLIVTFRRLRENLLDR